MLRPGKKAHRRKPPNKQEGYPPWRARAARELENRHQIKATAIAERIWAQFYARGLDPTAAAYRAQMVYRAIVPK